MSEGTRSKIAEKFARNWQQQNTNNREDETVHLDDSLTSLQWLHNITVLDMTPSVAIASESSQASSPCSTSTDDDTASEESHANLISNETVKIDYNNEPDRKPPYSYATLICMAMKETNKSKITLSGIYKWIRENFVYYRHADPTWQNSIRHNLSLNKCFVKVARKKDEPGKGGFWKIDPAYADMFVDGVFKRRRNSSKSARKTTPNKSSRSKSTSSMPLKHNVMCNNDVKRFKPDRGSWPYQRHSVSSDYNDTSYFEEEIPPFPNGGNQDLSWNALLADSDIDSALREAIDAQGIIIDHNFRVLNSPFTPPPPPAYYETEVFTPDDNLDLTIRGVGLTPSPRMPPSPPRMQQDHPWAEQPVDDVIASLDFLVSENLENHF